MTTLDAYAPRTDSDARPRGSTYAHLSRQIKHAGLLDRRVGYYIRKIAITSTMLIGGWLAFVLIGDSWWQLLVATFLAFVFTQIGFLGHDAGHRQVFASRRANYILGLVHGNLAIGLSYGWWVDKHNRHHSHPNQKGNDPDIEVGALAFTAERRAGVGRVTGFIHRWQGYLFFPLLLLEAVSLHVASVKALGRGVTKNRSWETILFTAHVVGYLTTVLLVLSPLKAVVFIVMQQALFGLYLGCAFAPNHKGMEMLAADDRRDFLTRQVITSRNVRGGWLTDFTLGGLNYQIEHHLFPSMPRPNLRRAQRIIRTFCRQHGLSYCETSLLDSYVQALRHLNTVGRTLSTEPAT